MIRVSIHEKISLKASLYRPKPGEKSPRVRCDSEVETATNLPRLIFTAEQMFQQVLRCPCLHILSLDESLKPPKVPNHVNILFFLISVYN